MAIDSILCAADCFLQPRRRNRISLYMPVTYQIDRDRQLIHTKCSGPVTIEEVVAHFHTLEHDPACPPRLNVLLDLTSQTSIPKKQNLQDVVGEIKRVHATVEFGACAIVARQDALFGMLRMFEVFAQKFFRLTYVFRKIEDAQEWLAAQCPRTSAAG